MSEFRVQNATVHTLEVTKFENPTNFGAKVDGFASQEPQFTR